MVPTDRSVATLRPRRSARRGHMLDPRQSRPPGQQRAAAPSLAPPPPFAERRIAYRRPEDQPMNQERGFPPRAPRRRCAEGGIASRRAEDQQMNEERVFLARALDAIAADASAEERLANLLRLLARTVGARRAAVLADGVERRVAVGVTPGEDTAPAEAFAAWLDAHADRTRAERAAAGRAHVSLVSATRSGGPTAEFGGERSSAPAAAYARVAIPRSAGIVLGFAFDIA